MLGAGALALLAARVPSPVDALKGFASPFAALDHGGQGCAAMLDRCLNLRPRLLDLAAQ